MLFDKKFIRLRHCGNFSLAELELLVSNFASYKADLSEAVQHAGLGILSQFTCKNPSKYSGEGGVEITPFEDMEV